MAHDPWLDRWLPTLRERAHAGPVLEIGCGAGDDTAVLVRAGFTVVAFDLRPEQVAAARRQAPAASIHVQDMMAPFPLEGAGIGVVLASLSIHYFPWTQTLALVRRIHDTLAPAGLFLARLNASDDIHFGATGHPEIEPGLHRVDGSPKRFFSRDDTLALFGQGWQVLGLEHRVTHKYGPAKRLWEVAVERTD